MAVERNVLPRVTVVMAVYNAARFVREAITSVLAQTYRDFELIAVDDSSSDTSLSILESLDDSRMRIVRHSINKGAAESRNDALIEARGELIAIMDADDVCAPTRLERQVAYLDENPHVGVLGCGIYDNIDASGTVLHTTKLPEDNEALQRTIMERWCFLHSSLMFRKSLYQTVGGYRKEFEPAEDHDFALRMLEHCQTHNLEERLVSYRLNPKGLSVIGHQYNSGLVDIAIRLARRRRSGQPECLDAEMPLLDELKRTRRSPRGLAGLLQAWRDTWYVANRYYEFGRSELGACHVEQGRRCFMRSLHTNGLFLKSWIGIGLSLRPFRHNGQGTGDALKSEPCQQLSDLTAK